MSSYDPVASSVAVDAMKKLQPGFQQEATIQLVSLKHTYNDELLDQFYEELMILNFPLEEERDDLDDWKACLDPRQRDDAADPGPDMDILLLLVGNDIAVGLAFEYYKRAQTGLLSYCVTATSYRRKGLVQSLHPVVLEALGQMHRLYNPTTTIRAVFCETNTIHAGDASPEDIRIRHLILYRLGYRQLAFPYVQPALDEMASSFDDIMLLIHCPSMTSITSNQTLSIPSSIPYDYVLDFFLSVHGGYHHDHDDHDLYEFSRHWYFRLASWFAKTFPSTDILQDSIWNDVTDRFHTQYINSLDPKQYHHVVIVGAGVSGLEAACHLAKEYNNKASSISENISADDKKILMITLVEANEHVGGRVRTVMTDPSVGGNLNSGGHHKRQYLHDLKLVADCQAFAPFPIAIGAEFLHGTNSAINDLAVDHAWEVEETFDLDALPEEDEDEKKDNAFLERPETKLMTSTQRQAGHVKVFGDGQLWDLKGGNRYDTTIQETRFHKCIRKAEQLWQELTLIAEDVYESNGLIPMDQSLRDFANEKLQKDGVSKEDIQTISFLLESFFANTAGSKLDCYGKNEASREEYCWEYTERNFRTRDCFGELIFYFLDAIESNNHKADRGESSAFIRLVPRCPIKSIDGFEQNRILVLPKDPLLAGDVFVCDKVIVTASLSVLKANKLKFCGDLALPNVKAEAIANVNMFSGIKAHMLLKKGFDVRSYAPFLETTELIFCPDEIFSQLWFRRNEDSVFATGFAAANCRDKLKQKENQDGITAEHVMLDQLARMFSDEKEIFQNARSPTCSAFMCHDWSDDEYVMGMYSSPSVGASWITGVKDGNRPTTSRDHLAMPIQNAVFFAGEHTNTQTSASVQAALETGTRSAKEVLESLLGQS